MTTFSDLIPIPEQVSPSTANAHGYADPTPLGTPEYERDHELVEMARACCHKNEWPQEIFTTYGIDPVLSPVLIKYLRLSESRPEGAADVVQMDHPFDIWDLVIEKYIMDEMVPLNPVPVGIPFVEGVEVKAKAHMLIAKGLRRAFEVKAHFDQLRPAQYNPMGDLIQKYPHPKHPEKPAGHGAFCGAAAKAFELFYSPTSADVQAIKTATQQFAMFRTMAGMHIPSSNQLGWQIGYDTVL